MTAPLIIAGGGLSGCLAALALAERRPDLPLLLLEGGETFGGNHIWSFFDTDIAPEHRWLADLLRPHRWSEHEVRFPRRRRRVDLAYNSVKSSGLHAIVRERLGPARYRLAAPVEEVGPDRVRLASGETLPASGVIDAQGPIAAPGLRLAWQKFVGLGYRFAAPHGLTRPVVMDALVDQTFGYRFVYLLPFSPTEVLVEDTYYSDEPSLDVPRLRRYVEDYARRAGWAPAAPVSEEAGVLPVVLSGSAGAFWPDDAPAVARLGLRGGFFHPTTGYSLPDAVANAALLAEQEDLSSAALHALFKRRAEALWSERGFYRMLNRMLFGAAGPRRRYKVLEHFYRLPDTVIGRFYAGRSTLFDKARILSGRPPVPLGAALRAAREAA